MQLHPSNERRILLVQILKHVLKSTTSATERSTKSLCTQHTLTYGSRKHSKYSHSHQWAMTTEQAVSLCKPVVMHNLEDFPRASPPLIAPTTLTCESVNRKTTLFLCTPAVIKSFFKSSLNSRTLYPLFNSSCLHWQPDMKAASRARDCLPEPPIPTNIAFPRGARRMRVSLAMCSIASLKNTRFMTCDHISDV